MEKIGILGSGTVGVTLANGLNNLGYDVSIANRKGNRVDNWEGKVDTYDNVSKNADLLVLAVKGSAAEAVIKQIAKNLKGKVIIDTTNPIDDSGPDNGVLSFFTDLNESLMERLQAIAPTTKFVKAFNCVGNAYMVNPEFGDTKPTMFICGNDDMAKNEVTKLLVQLGWEAEDFGGVKSARAIEPLCILWCIPGFVRNEWNHAFKLLKAV